MLIETLEARIPGAQVWHCLLEAGMTLEKFQKEWKKKSLFLLGKAELGLCNYQTSLDHFKAALSLIATDESPIMVKQSDELRTLISQAQVKRTAEKKKERATWSRAFEKGKTSAESMYSDPAGPDIGDSNSAAPSPLSSIKQSGGVNADATGDEDPLFIPLSQFGLKDLGTKKKSQRSAVKGGSGAEGTIIKSDTYWGFAVLAAVGAAVGLGGWWFTRRRW
jgi:hypothetical protein